MAATREYAKTIFLQLDYHPTSATKQFWKEIANLFNGT
jgi:hypothetical protein